MSRFLQIIALLFFFLIFYPSFSEAGMDLGVYGKTFEIKEVDLYEYIQTKLSNYDVQKLQKNILSRFNKGLIPKGFNMPVAEKDSTFKVDPSITTSSPIRDHQGNILIAAGTKANPLEHITLRNQYLFINDSKSHLDFAKSLQGRRRKTVIILTDGDPYKAMKKLKKKIFFARELLIEKFNIQHIPSLAYQNAGDMFITIKEFKLD